MHRKLKRGPATGDITLTDRDRGWLLAVHRYRFITTDQAVAISGSNSSRSAINRRLKELYDHKFLDRPAVQFEFSYQDRRPTVHALGQRGARWLEENEGVKFPKGKGWKTANNLKSASRIAHQIGLVDTVLQFQADVTAEPDMALEHQDELIAKLDWPKSLNPYRLPTKTEYQGVRIDRATDPDYTFSLIRTTNGRRQKSLCFLEWDNNSEDFIKANRLASAIAQKHRCYADAYVRKLHSELYGFKVFRVLFVIAGDEERRVEKIIDVCENVVEHVPRGIFWYTTSDQLKAEGTLGKIWQAGERQMRTLV